MIIKKVLILRLRCAFYIPFCLVLFMSSSCKENGFLGELIITEPIGVDHELEYVEVNIPIAIERLKKKALYIKSKKDGALIKGQVLNNQNILLESNLVRCLFPISIQANETKEYDIVIEKNEKTVTDLLMKGMGLNIIVENEFYKADLTARKSSKNIKLGPGQITSVSLKKYNGIKLERPDIKMHWAPSFQKKSEDYKTMAHLEEFDSVHIEKGPYLISVYRSGKVKGYEEIQLEGEYKFYAGKPYFGFSSKMTIVDSLTVTMLRNDEMTMDKFFTHAIYPLESGKVKCVPLYDKPPLISHQSIKELRKQPIAANAKWFGFYNDSINYGFGSIRIQFDYKNINGGLAPMINAQTKISYSYNEGRYWDRRFVDSGELRIPKGSEYFEENVYTIFDSNNENPAMEIDKLHKKLANPVVVKYIPVNE